jgi:hypothetical protein
MTDICDSKKTSYEINKTYIDKYYKKRYATDEEFRLKELDRINNNNKYRYKTDPEYRQKMKDNVKRYRAKMKELDNDLKDLEKLKKDNNEFLQQPINV